MHQITEFVSLSVMIRRNLSFKTNYQTKRFYIFQKKSCVSDPNVKPFH